MNRQPYKLTPEVLATIWRLRMLQRWTVARIARELRLGHTTVERAIARMEGEKYELLKSG